MAKQLKMVRSDRAVNTKKYILAVVLDPMEDNVVELFAGTGKELAKQLVDLFMYGAEENEWEEGVDYQDLAEVLNYIEENEDIESIVTLYTL